VLTETWLVVLEKAYQNNDEGTAFFAAGSAASALAAASLKAYVRSGTLRGADA
jgi:hypothetical protein